MNSHNLYELAMAIPFFISPMSGKKPNEVKIDKHSPIIGVHVSKKCCMIKE